MLVFALEPSIPRVLVTPAREVTEERLTSEEARDCPVLGRRMILALVRTWFAFVVVLVLAAAFAVTVFDEVTGVVVVVAAGVLTSYF